MTGQGTVTCVNFVAFEGKVMNLDSDSELIKSQSVKERDTAMVV